MDLIDFRGYTVRRRWGPELEARVRRVLETCHNPDSAKRALQVGFQILSVMLMSLTLECIHYFPLLHMHNFIA
jgi:hypothetical protein